MKINITIKLFLAILAVCAVVMFIQVIAMRFSFQHGFLGFLNDQGRQSMNDVRPRITAAYLKHRNWDFLNSDIKVWMETLRPPIVPLGLHHGPSPADLTGAIVRMGLLDENFSWISGNPSVTRESIRLPIVVGKKTVGWLAMMPFEQVLAPGETRFLESQMRVMLVIATVSVIIVALCSFLIARTILRRVRRLAKATRALAKGDYTSRIKPGPRDELGALAQDFNRMAASLDNNERTRRAFMADISHELRTPLAVIQAEIEAIQDRIRAPTAQSLGVMHHEILHLSKLIGDLHDLSMVGSGAKSYRMESLNITALIQTVAISMQRRFNKVNLDLQIDLPDRPMFFNGDESRLQQLFSNLLENSLRYTDSPGTVIIRGAQKSNTIDIIILDSSPGVDPEKQKLLFDRFYRVERSRNRASGGSGLGLAICRNITEAHGGNIWAESSQLGGLEIHIQLQVMR